ncbi:unnamed protein product [Sympodiomycopsis kandeliae]
MQPGSGNSESSFSVPSSPGNSHQQGRFLDSLPPPSFYDKGKGKATSSVAGPATRKSKPSSSRYGADKSGSLSSSSVRKFSPDYKRYKPYHRYNALPMPSYYDKGGKGVNVKSLPPPSSPSGKPSPSKSARTE